MKTVAELAKELNVSTQTIYRTLKNIEKTETESLTEKIRGVTYFNQLGEQLIVEHLTVFNSVEHKENELILSLQAKIKELEAELKAERLYSRKQADRIADLADKLAELSRNNQILWGAEQRRTNPTLMMGDTTTKTRKKQPVKKKSFWSLLKK